MYLQRKHNFYIHPPRLKALTKQIILVTSPLDSLRPINLKDEWWWTKFDTTSYIGDVYLYLQAIIREIVGWNIKVEVSTSWQKEEIPGEMMRWRECMEGHILLGFVFELAAVALLYVVRHDLIDRLLP